MFSLEVKRLRGTIKGQTQRKIFAIKAGNTELVEEISNYLKELHEQLYTSIDYDYYEEFCDELDRLYLRHGILPQ